MFHSTQRKHWGNQASIKKIREAITLIIDTAKLCDAKYSTEKSLGQLKNYAELEESDGNIMA